MLCRGYAAESFKRIRISSRSLFGRCARRGRHTRNYAGRAGRLPLRFRQRQVNRAARADSGFLDVTRSDAPLLGIYVSLEPIQASLEPSRSVLTFRAFALMKVSSVRAVYVATAILRTLDRPYFLIMVGSFKACLRKQLLPVPIRLANVWHAQAPCLAPRIDTGDWSRMSERQDS